MRLLQLPTLLFLLFCFEAQAEIRLEGSLSNSGSDTQVESTALLGYHQRFGGERSLEGEFFHSDRFGSTNSQISLKFEKKIPSGMLFNFGGSLLIQNASVTHLPYSTFMAGLEHPISDWGSGIGDIQTRFYSDAKVLILSYGVVIERLESWLIIPKIYLSRLEFEHPSKQSTDTAIGFRLVHPAFTDFDTTLSFSTGKEAYSAESGVLSTEVNSIGISLKYRGYKTWNPDISYQREDRPSLKRESHRIAMGLRVFSW